MRALTCGRLLLPLLVAAAAGCASELSGERSSDAALQDGSVQDAALAELDRPDAATAELSSAADLGQGEASAADSHIPADVVPAADPPLVLSLVFRQQLQSCSSCGIWFHWQEVQSQKPRLEVRYELAGFQQTRQYQHGLAGEDNAQAITLLPEGTEADRDERRHTLLIKKSPARTGLFRANLSDLPAAAAILSAKLYLHLEEDEGLAFSDQTSVFTLSECPGDWSWDTVTWNERAPGIAWSTPGGDAGRLVLEVDVGEDMHQQGFNKAAPTGSFEITSYLQLIQAERLRE